MKLVMRLSISMALSILLSCGSDATGPGIPGEEPPFWSEYSWVMHDFFGYPTSMVAGYSVRADSIYLMVYADSGYVLPDSLGVGFISSVDSLPGDCWAMDQDIAFRSAGSADVLDYYEFYYPYGLSPGVTAEPIPLTSDEVLGGQNDVTQVFYGEYSGDTTIVVRKLLQTPDPWDLELIPGNPYTMVVLIPTEMYGWNYLPVTIDSL